MKRKLVKSKWKIVGAIVFISGLLFLFGSVGAAELFIISAGTLIIRVVIGLGLILLGGRMARLF